MKKIFLLSAFLIATTSFTTVDAKDKKKQKKPLQQVIVEKAALRTQADSISYAAGMAMTRGLEMYLTQNVGITPAQMPEFMRGLREGIAHRKDSMFTAYSTGLDIAKQVEKNMLPGVISQFEGVEKIDADIIYQGFIASLQQDSGMFKQTEAEHFYQNKINQLKQQKDQANKAAGEKFLAENKLRPEVVTLPNGLQYRIITLGTGPKPDIDDRVNVIYEGRTIDGKVFDATSRHNTAHDTFGVKGLIQGWREALMLMPSGSKWEIYIPQELAYGERGAGRDIAPYSALIFTLELQSIVERPKVTESNDIPVTKSLKNPTSTVKSSKKSAPQKSVRTRK